MAQTDKHTDTPTDTRTWQRVGENIANSSQVDRFISGLICQVMVSKKEKNEKYLLGHEITSSPITMNTGYYQTN